MLANTANHLDPFVIRVPPTRGDLPVITPTMPRDPKWRQSDVNTHAQCWKLGSCFLYSSCPIFKHKVERFSITVQTTDVMQFARVASFWQHFVPRWKQGWTFMCRLLTLNVISMRIYHESQRSIEAIITLSSATDRHIVQTLSDLHEFWCFY